MHYPAFIAEMARESNRKRLWAGVWSGYAMAFAFAVLAIAGQMQGLVPVRWEFFALIVVKLATNTAAFMGLRSNRLVLETSGLNVVADIVVMTGTIYVTGGQLSPLFAIYVIEVAVLALLSNLGVTIIVSALVISAYTAMSLLIHAGIIPAYPPPAVAAGSVTDGYLVTDIVFSSFVIVVPAFFTSLMLRVVKRHEAALEARTAELVDAGKQKSLFMANVTHELRTPIHGICGLSDLVETGVYGPVTDRQAAAQQSIKQSAQSLLRLVDDLLTLSKADASRLELKTSEVDLDELVRGVVASAKWIVGNKDLTLTVDVAAGVPAVLTDRGKLNHVLVNLLSNAVKFTPDGGEIKLSARASGDDHVAISVEDNGPGIPPEQLELIFEAFHQVDGKMEREYGGVGLGLSLVKRLTNIVGAEIRVDSVVDQGTTFTVLLPRELRI
jgi:signal transduction histidine kinase